MKHKYIYQLPVYLLAGLMWFLASCTKDEHYTEYVEKAGIQLQQLPLSAYDKVAIYIQPNELTHSCRYALGTMDDLESFKAGSLNQTLLAYGNNPVQHVFEGLKPNTVYAVFAQAIEEDGQAGELAVLQVRTQAADFGVMLDHVGATNASITMFSTADYQAYVYAIGKPSDAPAFLNGTLPGIRLAQEKEAYSATFYNLEEQTDYTIFVMGYNRVDEPTPLYQIPIHTPAKAESASIISDIKIEPGLFKTKIDFEVSEHCALASVFFVEKGGVDVFIEEAFAGSALKLMHQWTQISYTTFLSDQKEVSGVYNTTKIFLDKEPFERAFEVFILLFDLEGRPTYIEHVDYSTPKFDDSLPEAQVEVKITDITKYGATYEFQGDENTVGYFFETFDADWLDEVLADGSLTEAQFNNLLQRKFFENDGPNTFTETTIPQPGYRVYLYYAGVNKNGVVHGLSKPQRYEYTSASK